jgi:signal recognition particle GTPase
MRDLRDPAFESQMAIATAAALQVFDRIIGELSPEERADPRSISESRVREIAQGAKVTPDDVSGFVHAFDYFARTAKDRARQRAQEWAIDISIHLTPVLLLAALAWLVWHLLRSF